MVEVRLTGVFAGHAVGVRDELRAERHGGVDGDPEVVEGVVIALHEDDRAVRAGRGHRVEVERGLQGPARVVGRQGAGVAVLVDDPQAPVGGRARREAVEGAELGQVGLRVRVAEGVDDADDLAVAGVRQAVRVLDVGWAEGRRRRVGGRHDLVVCGGAHHAEAAGQVLLEVVLLRGVAGRVRVVGLSVLLGAVDARVRLGCRLRPLLRGRVGPSPRARGCLGGARCGQGECRDRGDRGQDGDGAAQSTTVWHEVLCLPSDGRLETTGRTRGSPPARR